MGHLLEIILDILGMLLPLPDRKRSNVDESRMDRQARLSGYFFYAVLLLFLTGGILWFTLR